MATTELPADISRDSPLDPAARFGSETFDNNSVHLSRVLAPLASLKLTVCLFAVSIFLVFAGTLALIDDDIWYVTHNYFRCFFAWIELQVFFPRAWDIPGKFPFPGGWLVGGALGINLLAAHALRFKVTGKGRSLWIGWGLILTGSLFTYLVIQSGLGDDLQSELSASFCNGLWHALRAALGGSTLLLAYVLALSYGNQRKSHSFWLWLLGAFSCVLLAVLTGWLFANPDAKLDPSSLRILWQLIKSSGAGLILLTGCYLVFGRRGGIVLLHSGIALLMFSELFTGLQAVEAHMVLNEGETRTFAEDSRSVELAVVDKSAPHQDTEVIIPLSLLQEALFSSQVIEHPALPVKLRVVEYFPNSMMRYRLPDESSPADLGEGLLYALEGLSTTAGVDTEQRVELPGMYVELINSDSGASLGTILLWATRHPFSQVEPLQVDGKPYEISLRLKRVQKDYAVKLIDFRHDKYVGSNQAKNFSSDLQLIDPENQIDRRVRTWMNNPVRYGGDTIYQASYDERFPRQTTLQVVTNSGWMIPYVSCMLIATGMLAHFGVVFFRFAQRKTAPSEYAKSSSLSELIANWRSPAVWVPTVLLIVFGCYAVSKFRPASTPEGQMQLYAFGQIPVAYQGRVQPLDTLARNALTIISDKETVLLPAGNDEEETVPAIRWLIDLITDAPNVSDYLCLRIDNLEVLQTLGLELRPGKFRYSLAELQEHEAEYSKQISLASSVPEEKRTLAQSRFLRLANQVTLINVIHDSFSSPLRHIGVDSREKALADEENLLKKIQSLNQRAPRAVPPAVGGEPWVMLLDAENRPVLDALAGRPQKLKLDAAAEAFRGILASYSANDVAEFNQAIVQYKQILEERADIDAQYHEQFKEASGPGSRKTAERLSLPRLEFEAYFNHVRPFVLLMVLYLIAFLLSAGAWLGATTVLNRSANWLLWFTFVLHTAALIGRIYISGRPPVTNLYSSAVFIGWGAALFALVFERVYRMGIGNLLAATIGFPTLYIAHVLAGDGDTFEVLQAVLDTQFWLATHVVCITLGYSTTLLAGVLGIGYIVLAQIAGQLDDKQRQQLTRMTYGTICFATLFSFIGTILGGLWADDSWGRFWGWDPKENGALMIVIWNALVLHARWGGMIQRRGMATLAVFGNIVTAWSWFGVNAMGVGLHSYGFRAGMTFWLSVFVLSQLAFMLIGAFLPDKSDNDPKPLGDLAAENT